MTAHFTATIENGNNRRFYLLTAEQADVFVSYLWDRKLSFTEFWEEAQTMIGEEHNPAGWVPEQKVYYTWSSTSIELAADGMVQIGIPAARDQEGRTHRDYLEMAYAGMEYFCWWDYTNPKSPEAKRVKQFMERPLARSNP